MEAEGRSEMEFTDLQIAADSIDVSVMFHVVMETLGFVLYMHQQIPAVLQDINHEFDALHTEYKDLEVVLAQTEIKAAQRRVQNGRKREVKHGIKRFEKLMKTVASIQTALQLVFSEMPHIETVILGSPIRARHVYELCFSHGHDALSEGCDFTRTRAADAISRKEIERGCNDGIRCMEWEDEECTLKVFAKCAHENKLKKLMKSTPVKKWCFTHSNGSPLQQVIRILVSKGVGSDSYAGPSKLFLLVKACSSFNMPLHFLPKRDFRYNKKIMPTRVRIKCRNQNREIHALNYDPQPADSDYI
ncbi:hypothetical protein OSB04_022937, partial [Centaurea solstitialis]